MFSDGWSFLFDAVWLESPPLCCVLRPPQHCQTACECVQTSSRAEDQGTCRWPRTACKVACPVISACLLDGPSRTSYFTCFVVDRPIRIQSTYGGRLSTAQWNSLLRMRIMCGHPSKWIQFAFNLRLYIYTCGHAYCPCT